ncbi:hypothetical protein DSCO28_04920 [Desulfosarcina ovata subsp. sediminis]|uniref:CRISPR system ring nuclease SSO1393-like domain-containing protein n=3 Tax=Desulfosarcina ovata TaxID=83564 RepID=A0A5K8A3Y5_9BACT|nr:hypothetical protein DSCO28_04920 [Desulfosarcina ovata subsp. sediminis]BBO87229.1 hypothetical protein DSCOOX_04090 [Desulfosarcina ovata subsp. ovata]
MPLEAIAYHVEKNTLETVIVIPSADTPSTEKKEDGTFRMVGKFTRLFEKSHKFEVLNAGEIHQRWMEGVNYESARDLRDCLHDLYTWLRQKQYADDDIIVDITSGQKVCASVASVMSLSIGRQVQYVSTQDYTVRAYNISYEASA